LHENREVTGESEYQQEIISELH